jgi:hypothetical protein
LAYIIVFRPCNCDEGQFAVDGDGHRKPESESPTVSYLNPCSRFTPLPKSTSQQSRPLAPPRFVRISTFPLPVQSRTDFPRITVKAATNVSKAREKLERQDANNMPDDAARTAGSKIRRHPGCKEGRSVWLSTKE